MDFSLLGPDSSGTHSHSFGTFAFEAAPLDAAVAYEEVAAASLRAPDGRQHRDRAVAVVAQSP